MKPQDIDARQVPQEYFQHFARFMDSMPRLNFQTNVILVPLELQPYSSLAMHKKRISKTTSMTITRITLVLLMSLSSMVLAQTKPAGPKSVEDEKFVFLNNGVTVGMIVKSVLKADKQRLKLTDQQLPKAKQIITDATVKYNEGVKKLKTSGLNQKKLRILAIAVETEKAHQYQTILTSQQYAILAANHNKMYPESRL